MARFYGKVGFGRSVESPPDKPGKWDDEIVERYYKGDVLRAAQNLETDSSIVGDVSLSHRISIVQDRYAIEHLLEIKYVELAGERWVVTNIDDTQPPRLILSTGGVYNGPTS